MEHDRLSDDEKTSMVEAQPPRAVLHDRPRPHTRLRFKPTGAWSLFHLICILLLALTIFILQSENPTDDCLTCFDVLSRSPKSVNATATAALRDCVAECTQRARTTNSHIRVVNLFLILATATSGSYLTAWINKAHQHLSIADAFFSVALCVFITVWSIVQTPSLLLDCFQFIFLLPLQTLPNAWASVRLCAELIQQWSLEGVEKARLDINSLDICCPLQQRSDYDSCSCCINCLRYPLCLLAYVFYSLYVFVSRPGCACAVCIRVLCCIPMRVLQMCDWCETALNAHRREGGQP